MKRNYICWLTMLVAGLIVLNALPAAATGGHQPKRHGMITKRQAEQIALNKVRGGTIRTAELQSAHGSRFWSVYVMRPGFKNAKEVRIDATTGEIFNVQTERPEDQAEEPAKTH